MVLCVLHYRDGGGEDQVSQTDDRATPPVANMGDFGDSLQEFVIGEGTFKEVVLVGEGEASGDGGDLKLAFRPTKGSAIFGKDGVWGFPAGKGMFSFLGPGVSKYTRTDALSGSLMSHLTGEAERQLSPKLAVRRV